MGNKIIYLMMVFLLAGCAAKRGHQFLEKTSNQEISSKLVAQKTTKEEVNQMFGDPEDVDMTYDGGETWLYKYVRSEAKAANFIPIVGDIYHGTNDNIRKLKIQFNKCGLIERYSFSSSKGETKAGLFQ